MPHTDVNFVKALGWANEKHKEDYRKGTDIPYFSHLMLEDMVGPEGLEPSTCRL